MKTLTTRTMCILSGLLPTAVALLLFFAPPGAAFAKRKATATSPPCALTETEPIVQIIRGGRFNGIAADNYAHASNDDLIGTISNSNFYRFWDGTCGSYKVPVRIVAPKGNYCDRGRLAHVGLVELIHPNYIGSPDFPPGAFAGVVQGQNDPVYDSLLDHGYHEAWGNLREWFLFGNPRHGGGGVVYMGFQANNFVGELDYIAGLPDNQGLGLHLERPQDYAILYRDVSRWLREPKTPLNFIGAERRDLCEVSDVVGFGYSYTARQLKAVIANPHHLNSTWGSADRIFARGRVLDGVLLAGFPGECPDVTASDERSLPCNGPDDRSEGPMVLVQSEADVQFFPRSARPGPPGNPAELSHYKVHEIDSAAHLERPYYPYALLFEYLGLDPSLTRQNPLDRSPVLRADLVNLVAKIRHNRPLPVSAYMDAEGSNSAFGYGIVSLDRLTGNGFGGVKLPQAAAPLGLYRGTDCHNLFSNDFDITDSYHYAPRPRGSGDLTVGRARYLLEKNARSPAGSLCAETFGVEGIFTPYGTVDDALGTSYCANLYPTRQAYSERVAAAADRLIARRYLLPEDRNGVIAAAEAAADEFPDCVPRRVLSAIRW
jgi:hypothetical protein